MGRRSQSKSADHVPKVESGPGVRQLERERATRRAQDPARLVRSEPPKPPDPVLRKLLKDNPGVRIWYEGRWHVGGASKNNSWKAEGGRPGFSGPFRGARGGRSSSGRGGRLPGSFETGKRR